MSSAYNIAANSVQEPVLVVGGGLVTDVAG